MAHRLFAARPRSETLVGAGSAAVTLAGSLVLLTHVGPHPIGSGWGGLDGTGLLLTVCTTLPLLTWHRAPFAVVVLTASASVLLSELGYPLALPLGAATALYLFAASRNEEQRWTPIRIGGVLALIGAYLIASDTSGGQPGIVLVHAALPWAVAWFAGERTRLRHARLAELNERAAKAERESERERLLAVAEERARIARDLHDSAGHAINVIALRAGTARLRHDEDHPERDQIVLAAIEEIARDTAAEVDQIVGALRDAGIDGVEIAAPPGLASLETLVQHRSSVGLDVTLETTGARRPLGAAVDQAAYRILQEALTNAACHGSGDARIELHFNDGALELAISNRAVIDAVPVANGGHGLIGMRERAEILGGSFEAERANGSFRVRATLPYDGRRP